MTTIAEHTVDLSLIPRGGTVLDIGCRGFLFTDEMERLGFDVYPVDIDLLGTSRRYYILAIAGHNGKCAVKKDKDPQATRMTDGFDIPCYTIQRFSELVVVDFWDCIKIDAEGAEYEIIMNLTEPPSTQLSIEFHLHTKIYGDAQVKDMEDKLLSLGYFPMKHDKTSQHGCGMNYWDSLWILKDGDSR